MRTTFFALLLVGLFILGCKKDSDVPAETRPTIELLTNNSSKSWKVKDGTAKSQNGLEVNLIASQNPCITDNVIVLSADFSYKFLEGATKCNPSDPDQILAATWSLSQDNSSITIDKFIFLGRTIDKPSFVLTEVTEATFSGTTTITFEGEVFNLNVIFGQVI